MPKKQAVCEANQSFVKEMKNLLHRLEALPSLAQEGIEGSFVKDVKQIPIAALLCIYVFTIRKFSL